MKRLISIAVCAIVAHSSAAAGAEQRPILIHNSRSPNREFEIWMRPGEDGEVAEGTAQIRSVKTQKTLSTFEWSGFGVHADADAFEVLWRPDSKAFAIKWECNRGWMTGAIYARNAKHRWGEVKLPAAAYVGAIKKMNTVAELYGKGCDSPKRWLDDGQLLLAGC